MIIHSDRYRSLVNDVLCVLSAAFIVCSGAVARGEQPPPQENVRTEAQAGGEGDSASIPAKGDAADKSPTDEPRSTEPKQAGGETQGIVHVANLVYAGTKTSKCFADHFLIEAEKASKISTNRRFHAVKLGSTELFEYPLVIMTGEGSFTLTDQERKNLRTYIDRGGFLLASAGCSSSDWNQSFRAEMTRIFPDQRMTEIDMKHPVFHTVYDIDKLQAKHGEPKPLEGITVSGRLGVLYSQDGLNDTSHTQGCCCCGGNEITNAIQINVNILAYALVF